MRDVVLTVIVIVLATLFVFLGLWQLDRREQRLESNRLVRERMVHAPVPLESLPDDPAAARHRMARVSGRLDYDNELVHGARTRQGSPGVHILTPLLREGREIDTAVLVNRGWVYSPNAASVELERWREAAPPGKPHSFAGRIEVLSESSGGEPTRSGQARLIGRLSRAEVQARLPYPVRPYVLVLEESETANAGSAGPARSQAPSLDGGPHLGYALQWFSFAVIAVVGLAAFLRSERRRVNQ